MPNANLTPLSLTAALYIAAAYVAWPMVGRYLGLGGPWVSTMVLVVSTIAGTLIATPQMLKQPLPPWEGLGWMAVVSVLNGIAVYIYSTQTSDKEVPAGAFMAATTIAMVVLGVLAGWYFFGEAMSARKWLGVVFAAIAIWLIAA
jgi:drug/metabolite transporter (DMT)-like permease